MTLDLSLPYLYAQLPVVDMRQNPNLYPNKLKNWNLARSTLEILDHRNSLGVLEGDEDGLVARDVGEDKTNSSTSLGIDLDARFPSQKIVSQALYGERVIILEEQGPWVQIQTPDDLYQGWVKKDALLSSRDEYFSEVGARFIRTNRLKALIYHTNDTEYGPILTLPFGRKLKVLEELQEAQGRWIKIRLLDGKEGFIQRGDVDTIPTPVTFHTVVNFAKQFIGLPYTWGGRSSFGYDCSGFMQMLFKEMGFLIPRDAKDQYADPHFIPVNMDSLQTGDLIFFGPKITQASDNQRITHVGMYIGEHQFIQAGVREQKPYICICNLHSEAWEGESSTIPFKAARRHIQAPLQKV